MRKLIAIFFSLLIVLALLFSGCKTKKGCGCGSNLNYYTPRKSKA